MKISVLIPSRGRPFRLRDMLNKIRSLESGKHEIGYVVGADADDEETVTMARLLNLYDCRVAGRCMVRMPTLGGMVNRLIEENPADAYVCLPDDAEILTPHWDEAIASAWEARPDGVWWWRTLAVRPATYAIVSEKWRMAAGGKIWTDLFPFWWDDMWLLQVWMFASGLPMLPIDAWLDDQAQATHRMRDLKFWSDFYSWNKGKRQRQAIDIAKALGWPPAPCDDNRCDVNPAFYREADNIEANQGDKGPVTPEYRAAYQRARSMMGLPA